MSCARLHAGAALLGLAVLWPVSVQGQVFWTDPGAVKIQQANLDGSGVQDVVVNSLHVPVGLALDLAGGKMYWTDEQTVKIQRANLDGSRVEDLVTNLQIRPLGVALDLAAGKMYWTVQGSFLTPGRIQRANLDGSEIEDLVTAGLLIPREIALDPAGGKMYWTHGFSTGNARIQRANLDGSDVETLVDTDVFLPSGIALDLTASKMYWSDANRIQRANLDGSEVEEVIAAGLGPERLALDLAAGKVYWTGAEAILRANLDGSGAEILATFGLATSLVDSDPVGIALDPASGLLYWADRITGMIRRSNLDGTNITDLLVRSLSTPRSIDLDPIAGRIYWTDGGFGTSRITRADLDGSNVADALLLPLVIAGGLALDIPGQQMFWTQSDEVRRANLDGSNNERIFLYLGARGIAADPLNEKVYWLYGASVRDDPFGGAIRFNFDGTGGHALFYNDSDGVSDIDVDPVGGHMYWTDVYERAIQRANLDGSDIQTLLSLPGSPSGLAIDAARGRMYWTDTVAGTIQRADLAGDGVEDFVSGLATPTSVAVMPAPLAASGLSFDDPAAGPGAYIEVFDQLGVASAVGAVGAESGPVKDVAVDPTSGLIYTVEFVPSAKGQQIFVVDPATGTGTTLPDTTSIPLPRFIWGLAFDAAGQLYGGGLGLYKIDKQTGRAEGLADLGIIVLGMADSPTGAGFISTGKIPFAGLVIPYLALHDATGTVVDAAVLVDGGGESRLLFDIALTPGGRLYGTALPAGLFATTTLIRDSAAPFAPGRSRPIPQKQDLMDAGPWAAGQRASNRPNRILKSNLLPPQAWKALFTPASSQAVDELAAESADMASQIAAQLSAAPTAARRSAAGGPGVGSDLVLIQVGDTMAFMTPGGPLDAILLGLGGMTEPSPE